MIFDGKGIASYGTAPRPLVLVIDDNHEGREGCALLLAQAGFHVATAINGLDGLVKALTLRPDVILMDLAMPDLDGLDCTRQLCAAPATRDIPVIALTAHCTAEVRALALAAGCRAFVIKPFVPATLIEEVDRLARSGRFDPAGHIA
jgi:two-component system cell cycle response regulator DivK